MDTLLRDGLVETPEQQAERPWRRFVPGVWQQEVNVRDFIVRNVHPYAGDSRFLTGPTGRTKALWDKVTALLKEERAAKGGVLDADTEVFGSIIAHAPAYIDQELELVVGLQTDKPLKRAIMPFGGWRMVKNGLEAYGFKPSPKLEEVFPGLRKSHNDGVFDVYTEEMLRCRKSGVITGLPDAYGRGRIIGDYRRLALYGATFLIEDKKAQYKSLELDRVDEHTLRLREEITEQIKALKELAAMAKTYGFDVSRPAANAREAVQWTYLAYLAAVKEANGAAMSLGRVSSFLDVYVERDLRDGLLTEEEAQELIDQFVTKLRIVRFLRTPEYDQLFSGDPTWVTECIGGMALDGRTLVTKNSFRMLQTLNNLGPAPEPNLTVLWSESLPEGFKKFCAETSIKTCSVQYENDDLMRPYWGDDYGIACCVSAMRIGKQMQFFGARANLAKTLLYAINGGRDEVSGEQVGPAFAPITGDVLDHDTVVARLLPMMEWLARAYMNTLNAIHFMHDKYMYERLEMALHDRDVLRTMACGIAGLSVVADSLSAIKHATVKVVRDERGLATDFVIEGDYPAFGNNDDRVDGIAVWLVETFMGLLRKQKAYRDAVPTQSVLTITSNVVYGKKTGNTPDGRKAGQPFAPGANPMHGRDRKGAIASMASVAKLPYAHAQDGISYTFTIVPGALGPTGGERVDNLVGMLDGYFGQGGHHINVNVFDRETLLHAMDHPELYPQLTIRVSGYAVNFIKLTREQQMDVISRTFHGAH
ncbi:formate C-acetyltransferase [Azospirillum brasilense]|uniref:Formate acetyltransferase n=3 Tax=Azospirillum TaxID=191 RepID=A0A0P0EIX5_AZOBR|nr:formate C-acetyltransferase [Azospirillum brasilense]ALJ39036.1 formate acetyltransferase [Azospirillum brasilense]MDW7557251.1 formate C-acetyltransferase [Azospirillum brasilense]MDW7596253.1 formate C-acetyltransferase [Azospirillum brasilense]MDX5950550.1 formate C-acetyltransferase [Azospirillum brasilense]OPH14251.1 formate acetyltransferase [Azospirillum brasilense]